jgi:hypothetical protein
MYNCTDVETVAKCKKNEKKVKIFLFFLSPPCILQRSYVALKVIQRMRPLHKSMVKEKR